MSLLGLAACGGGGEAGEGELILSVSPFMEEVARKQTARFNAAHPDGPAVKLRVMPEDTGQYFGQLRTQFQAGGNDIAVIAGDVIWPPQLAEPGWITDLSDRFTRERQQEFLPGTVAAMVYEDRVWGVPWFTDSGLLYYRQDLLEDAGFSDPPGTWDELKEMAAKVQEDGGAKHGFVFTGAIYEGGTVLGTEFIRGAGGDVLDGKEVTIAAPEAIRGLTVQHSLVADGIAPEAVGNFKEDEASGAFLRGDAVFMRMWPYAYDLLSDPEQSELETAQVGLAQVPVADAGVTPVNVGGGWNFYVNAAAGDQDGAWALIEFLTAAEQQKEMALDRQPPPDAHRGLRRPRGARAAAGGQARQGRDPADDDAAGVALLRRHVGGDGQAVQRERARLGHARAGGADAAGGAVGDRRARRVSVRVDPASGLPTALGEQPVELAFTVVTGGAEAPGPVGGLTYPGAERTRLAPRAVRRAGDVVEATDGAWTLALEYRLRPDAPHVAIAFTLGRAAGAPPVLLRDVELTFTLPLGGAGMGAQRARQPGARRPRPARPARERRALQRGRHAGLAGHRRAQPRVGAAHGGGVAAVRDGAGRDRRSRPAATRCSSRSGPGSPAGSRRTGPALTWRALRLDAVPEDWPGVRAQLGELVGAARRARAGRRAGLAAARAHLRGARRLLRVRRRASATSATRRSPR